MKSNKEYRFEKNPMEKIFHDNFKEHFEDNKKNGFSMLSAVVFGWADEYQTRPKDFLNHREEDICINLIQFYEC